MGGVELELPRRARIASIGDLAGLQLSEVEHRIEQDDVP